PVGVCGQIIPWNFPLLMCAWKLAPALACGNTSVLKPAEQTPLTALRLGELLLEAGVPAGVVNIVPGFGPTAGGALVRHPMVDKIAFTGSTEVGKEIHRETASTLKRVSLELGGKSPNIVFSDADMDAAVQGALLGVFFCAGQVCCAGTRLFVEQKTHDEFADKLAKTAAGMKQGPGLDPETRIGPLVSQEQLERVTGYLEVGKKEGAKALIGGERNTAKGLEKGYYVKPTVFTGVRNDMKIAREEIFGPVVSVIPFKDENDAVLLGNDTAYGLAAGMWTRDVRKAHPPARPDLHRREPARGAPAPRRVALPRALGAGRRGGGGGPARRAHRRAPRIRGARGDAPARGWIQHPPRVPRGRGARRRTRARRPARRARAPRPRARHAPRQHRRRLPERHGLRRGRRRARAP